MQNTDRVAHASGFSLHAGIAGWPASKMPEVVGRIIQHLGPDRSEDSSHLARP
jgi:hypothetical protein